MRTLIFLWTILGSNALAQSITLDHPNTIYDVAISRMGDQVATAGKDSVVNIYTLNGNFVRNFTGFSHSLSKVIFTDADSKVVAGDYAGFIYMLDLKTGSMDALKVHNQAILDIHEILSANRYVTTGRDQVAKIWTSEWELIAKLAGHKGQVRKVTFNGERIITAADDSYMKVWNLSGQLIRSVETPHESAIWELAAGKDGYMVTGDQQGTVVVWNDIFEVISKWNAHDGAISGIVMLREYIITCAVDGHINIWELGGKLIKNIAAHEKYCTGISLSPNQSMLVSGGGDGKVKIWSMNQLLN
ncbi:WD40 repeat domain-containing protein [Reichenbachiella sp.]|uniref:WD40 repeat domain-containing protein n=1 Tax=Reichenbachiella sp. TaxID=2184521 RepID=UPI003B5C59DF